MRQAEPHYSKEKREQFEKDLETLLPKELKTGNYQPIWSSEKPYISFNENFKNSLSNEWREEIKKLIDGL